jgi:hypothetical protein
MRVVSTFLLLEVLDLIVNRIEAVVQNVWFVRRAGGLLAGRLRRRRRVDELTGVVLTPSLPH